MMGVFMDPKRFAFISGLIFLLMGVSSLIFPGAIDPLPTLKIETSYGLFLGIFPMNIFNKIALILFGIAGLRAASDKFASFPLSIFFSRAIFFVMGIAAILGLIPQTNTFFGYWPLFGNEVFAHGLFAILGAYFGYALKTKLHNQEKNFNKSARI